ncbi:LytTR family DNA-binding domain-containing protein [Ferruginibacter sp. HRS2-29]|uniref:LytR/AlgR family response regulator transcription factor n=1 Tax=Ferruginibacter sp. HRS2-29 TaxID=2487334 RepID=UPI0020CE7B11|nr:LytTR family DNA-binding domain-containing protein [Ferruginibacter sp. HRS2-29]MCP9752613.1 DNA-binding response regulator [Ferruginibacter sp. HRS2-29]
MINCLIVDDEPLAQAVLESYLERTENLCLIKKCSTAFEAFEALHHEQIDLIFLDVKMPALNGIDFLKSLKNPPAVIFTTAFSEYAVASYDLEAVDYLLKPITKERFDKSLAKLFKLQPVPVIEIRDYTYFKVSGKLLKVAHQDILYARSVKDYILLHTITERHMIHMTMKSLNEILPVEHFLRIHRSYLVNKNKIGSINKSRLQIRNDALPIGKLYKINLSLINGVG